MFHLIIWGRSKINTIQKFQNFSLKFWHQCHPQTILVVIKEFILRGMSFIYIMYTKGPTIYLRETSHFNVHQSRKKFWGVLGDFFSTFCLLLVSSTRTSLQIHLECHRNVIYLTKFCDLCSQKLCHITKDISMHLPNYTTSHPTCQ